MECQLQGKKKEKVRKKTDEESGKEEEIVSKISNLADSYDQEELDSLIEALEQKRKDKEREEKEKLKTNVAKAVEIIIGNLQNTSGTGTQLEKAIKSGNEYQTSESTDSSNSSTDCLSESSSDHHIEISKPDCMAKKSTKDSIQTAKDDKIIPKGLIIKFPDGDDSEESRKRGTQFSYSDDDSATAKQESTGGKRKQSIPVNSAFLTKKGFFQDRK